MKDEIKISEILEGKLDYIKKYINAAKRNNVSLNGGYQAISFHHWEELLDYITNLQDRIDKAIEYIGEENRGDYDNFVVAIGEDNGCPYWACEELLEILKGKSDE